MGVAYTWFYRVYAQVAGAEMNLSVIVIEIVKAQVTQNMVSANQG